MAAIIRFVPNGTIISCSPKVCDLFGYTKEELTSERVWFRSCKFLQNGDHSTFAQAIRCLGEEKTYCFVDMWKRKNGEEVLIGYDMYTQREGLNTFLRQNNFNLNSYK